MSASGIGPPSDSPPRYCPLCGREMARNGQPCACIDGPPFSAYKLIEDGRLIAEWLGRAVKGARAIYHPFAGYRLPGDVADAMRRLTGSPHEQVPDAE